MKTLTGAAVLLAIYLLGHHTRDPKDEPKPLPMPPSSCERAKVVNCARYRP